VTVLLVVATLAILFIAAVGRPLFFASVDADVARAGGVPVALLGFFFLLVLGLSVAETSQITGALLVFALLVTPAATAHQLDSAAGARHRALGHDRSRRYPGSASHSRTFSIYPVGFYVTSLSFALYVFVRVGCALGDRRRRNVLVPEPA